MLSLLAPGLSQDAAGETGASAAFGEEDGRRKADAFGATSCTPRSALVITLGCLTEFAICARLLRAASATEVLVWDSCERDGAAKTEARKIADVISSASVLLEDILRPSA